MDFSEWQKAQSDNWFTSDQNLQRTLEFYVGSNAYKPYVGELYRFGRTATTINTLANKLTPPQYAPFDALGNANGTIRYAAEHDNITNLIQSANLRDSDNDIIALALFYLSAQSGEVGQNALFAQTAAVNKLLEETGNDPIEEDKTAVIGLDEIGAGLSADYVLISDGDDLCLDQNPGGVPLATVGFSTLAVGRRAAVQPTNRIVTERGRDYLDDTVLSTVRMYRATACAAHARRAYMTAWTYAANVWNDRDYHINNAHTQVLLTQMRSDAVALASGTFHIAQLLQNKENGGDDNPDLPAILRVATNLHAIRTAELALDTIQNGFNVLGMNGMLAGLSPLTRLQQDTIMYSLWMGGTGEIAAELQRDCQQFAMHVPFLARVKQLFSGLTVHELKQAGLAQCDQIEQELDAILQLPDDEISTYLLPVMRRLIDLFYVGCMAVESAWEQLIKQDRTKQRLAEFLLKRRVINTPLGEWKEYPTWVGRLCHEIRPSRVDWGDAWDGMDDPLWE